jgi:hypothetical protein
MNWHSRGIPPVTDRIEATLDVGDIKNTGEVVQGLVGLYAAGLQVGVKIFPYGIPTVDGALVNLEINASTQQFSGSTGGGG